MCVCVHAGGRPEQKLDPRCVFPSWAELSGLSHFRLHCFFVLWEALGKGVSVCISVRVCVGVCCTWRKQGVTTPNRVLVVTFSAMQNTSTVLFVVSYL